MSTHELLSQSPGVVVAHLVASGERVRRGDPVLVVEAMKCEQRLHASADGKVVWLAPVGTVTTAGSTVARLGPGRTPRPPAPAETVAMAMAAGPDGRYQRLELSSADHDGRVYDVLVPAGTAPATNSRGVGTASGSTDERCGIEVGIISHRFDHLAEPVERVWLCGDATVSLGAVAEPECRRIIAAIDLAETRGVPLEWVAVSSGARVSMSSGTENMDWCAAVVRRLVEFTQTGGEVTIVVAGINVGAQSYWNAEATMLMHCAGTLIMVRDTAMVLTGHRSLARAGGVSEDSDDELGGVGVMGANGEAHHVVEDLRSAFDLVVRHHELCAGTPTGGPIRVPTADSPLRDVTTSPYTGPVEHGWGDVGEILSPVTHPGRNRPFSIRPVMDALADVDAPRLERWADMAAASGAVVWDTRLDGWPVSLIGVESHPRGSGGSWQAAGTLYPMTAKKMARAFNRASGRRPVVVLANLAGFDGSRASLLDHQLEYGAELARAVVNFDGPIVVVVAGRFHGGAYVVLSRQLNPELSVVALTGTRVSVIGGASAAEVVLRDAVDSEMDTSGCSREEALASVAGRFDAVHDVERARRIGSVDEVVDPGDLRAMLSRHLGERLRRSHPMRRSADRNAVPV